MLHLCYTGPMSPGWGWLKTHKHLTGTQEDWKTSPLCLYRKLEPFSMLLSGFAIIKSQPRWFLGFLRLEPGKKAAEGFVGVFFAAGGVTSPAYLPSKPHKWTMSSHMLRKAAFWGWQSLKWAGDCVPLSVTDITRAFCALLLVLSQTTAGKSQITTMACRRLGWSLVQVPGSLDILNGKRSHH